MEESILRTLCYSDVFEYPLLKEELLEYLIAERKRPIKKVEKGIESLLKTKQIVSHTDNDRTYFALATSQHTFSQRKSREKISEKKMAKTQKLLPWLVKIPNIRAVFLTGSLAMRNAQKNDDIDLMIVTRTGTLWQTRILVTMILDLFFERRRPEDAHTGISVSNSFCPNIYLDESCLAVPKISQNLYTAHEVIQAKVLFDRGDVANRFKLENPWIKTHLPYSTPPGQLIKEYTVSKKTNIVTNILEELSYQFQKRYMKTKRTREVVKRNCAFFHPRDTRTLVMNLYQDKLQQVGL